MIKSEAHGAHRSVAYKKIYVRLRKQNPTHDLDKIFIRYKKNFGFYTKETKKDRFGPQNFSLQRG